MRNWECGIAHPRFSFRIPHPAFHIARLVLARVMVPWPLAVLALFYGAIATLSGAMLWKIAAGMSHQPMAWAIVWLACSSGATVGLALLRPWGRRLAIWTSWLLIAATLAVAAALVAGGRPVAGLIVTFSTSGYYLVIRYLKRPLVVAWFGESPTKPMSSST